MPFSFNSLPNTDAGAALAAVTGQSTAAGSGLLPQNASTPSDASFDTCLTQAKQTPGTSPGKTPATPKAPADAAARDEATEEENDASTSDLTTSGSSGAVLGSLASLNNLLGLVVPPPPPAPVSETTDATADFADTSASNADGADAGILFSDAEGSTAPTNAFSQGAGISKKRATTPTVSPDEVASTLPDAKITKGIQTDAKGSAATEVKGDGQTEVVTPSLDQPADAVPARTTARGPRAQSSKSLARMHAAGPYGPALFSGPSTSTSSTTATTTSAADLTPFSSSVQSLRAMLLSPVPAPAVDTAAIVAAQTAMAGAAAASAASVPVPGTSSNVSSAAAAPSSARDLLASGAPVLEYFVSSDQTLAVRVPKNLRSQKFEFNGAAPEDQAAAFTPNGDGTTVIPAFGTGSVPTTPPTSIPLTETAAMAAPAKGANISEDLLPEAFVAQVSAVAVSQTPATPDVALAAPRFDGANAGSLAPQAKIAAADDGRVSSLGSGDKSSTRGRKNSALLADNKGVTQSASGVGTDTAKRVSTMSYNNPVHAENARSSDPFLSLAGLSAAASNASNSPAAETAPSNPVLSSHAAQTVREIRDIADGLWAVDRSSVEVRFNFTDSEKLSVRVEFKDGAVHTTFRTDSPELRDTLAREWLTQTPTAGSDIRPYRVADPVFGSGSSNHDQHSSFTGGDASRQQQQQQQRFFEQSAASSQLSFASSRSSGASTVPVPNPAQRTLKTDTSSHLNAFA